MPKQIYVHIPKPCHEKWEEMTPNAQGAFCHSCKKNVIDFTNKTENEIYHTLTQANGEVCGRLTRFQLQQPMRKTEVNNGFLNWRAMAAALAALFSFSKPAMAGDTEPAPKTATVAKADTVEMLHVLSDTLPVEEPVAEFRVQKKSDCAATKITGRVIDALTKEPVEGARINVDGGSYALTDSNGYFALDTLSAGLNDTLTVSGLWYQTKQFALADFNLNQPVQLLLDERTLILGGAMVVVEKLPLNDMGGYNDLTPWLERLRLKRQQKRDSK